MTENGLNANSSRRDQMLKLLVQHQTMLSAYVSAIVHDPDLTNDILGDLAVLISSDKASFDLDRPVGPLLRGIARNLTMQALKQRQRFPVPTDPDLLDEIAPELDELDQSDEISRRKEALRACFGLLDGYHRQLLELRYFERQSYDEIERLLKRSVNSLHVMVCRIHKHLAECVRTRLKEGAF